MFRGGIGVTVRDGRGRPPSLFVEMCILHSRVTVGTGRCQVVVAPLMMVSSISVGVCPFKTSRGRPLSWSWTAWTWASVTSVKLVPLGKYSRISPPVFSLVGR